MDLDGVTEELLRTWLETETSGLGLQYTPVISCCDDIVLYIHSARSDTLSSEYFTGGFIWDTCLEDCWASPVKSNQFYLYKPMLQICIKGLHNLQYDSLFNEV